MANVTIDDLNPKASPVAGDQLEIDDGAGGSFKTTKAQLQAALQADVDAKADSSDLTAHENDTNNPHSVTHAQLPDNGTNTHAQIDAHVDGPVTDHTDVTSAGSGQIITATERTKLNGIEAGAQNNTNSNAGTGAGLVLAKVASDTPIKSLIGGTGITLTENASDVTIDASGGGGAGTYNETTKDDASISVGRAKLEFRDTGDATVTVTDDAAGDRTIINIDSTAGAGGGGVAAGTPFVVGELTQVSSAAGDGEIVSSGSQVSDFATAAQGAAADTAVQPNDPVSDLANDAGYGTGDVTGVAPSVPLGAPGRRKSFDSPIVLTGTK